MRPTRPVLAAVLLLAACGTQQGTDAAGTAGEVPITQRAIAAVALDHAPDDTTSREAMYTDDTSPEGLLGADLRYGGDGESDGDLLEISVQPSTDEAPCDGGYLDGCETRDVDGGSLSVLWQEVEPEEDPGIVLVVMERDDVDVSVLSAGEEITGDPREMDLAIPVAILEQIAQDPRLGLTTSPEVVEAGERLEEWDGGEPDPAAYDRVPSTDVGQLNAYLMFRGGYGYYSGFESSPLLGRGFGDGTLGGRMRKERFGRDEPAQTIDVLAAPLDAAPAWMRAEDPCAAYAGSCEPAGRGRFLAWTPGPNGSGGEVWHLAQRDDQVVVTRHTGFDVPTARADVEVATDWYTNRDFLLDDTLGLTTEKQVLDFQP